MPDCKIERWLSEKVSELRRFISDADDAETLRLLHQIREDFEASRRRHREDCPRCFGKPTYGDFADDPALVESLGADLGEVVRYKSDRPLSRRGASRCRH